MEKDKALNFVQLKCVRKDTKPPIWRRVIAPTGITFAQLALILERALELEISQNYTFEFYSRKDWIFEIDERYDKTPDLHYDMFHASDNFIDDRMLSEKRFSFILNEDDKEDVVYKVEIEKHLKNVGIKRDGGEALLQSPLIIKQVAPKDDEHWSDINAANELFESKYAVCFKEPSDKGIIGLLEDVEGKGIGIERSDNPENKDARTIYSFFSTMSELTHQFVEDVSADLIEEIEKLKEDIRYDEATDTYGASEEEVNEELNKIKSRIRESVRSRAETLKEKAGEERTDFKKSHTSSLEDIYADYTKQNLLDTAEETGYAFKSKKHSGMAYELARYMLEPDTMKRQLLEADEDELDAFEGVISKGRYKPEAKEAERLERLFELTYLAEYINGDVEVPTDVAAVYGALRKSGYRDRHRKIRWLTDCIRCFYMYHGVAPTEVLVRMYNQREHEDDAKAIMRLIGQVPEKWNPCVIKGKHMVAEDMLRDNVYLNYIKNQRGKDFFIPSPDEIVSSSVNHYPASEPSYQELYNFLGQKLKLGEEKAGWLCRVAFNQFSSGGMPSDYMDVLNKEGIEFGSMADGADFARLMMDVSNNTRRPALKGNKPLEIAAQTGGLNIPFGNRPKIVPMSSMAAEMLEAGRSDIEGLGWDIDIDATASKASVISFPNGLAGKTLQGAKKIYPNDPCPCGSGRKYKYCCGKK